MTDKNNHGKKLTRRNAAHNAVRKGSGKGFGKNTGGSASKYAYRHTGASRHARGTSESGSGSGFGPRIDSGEILISRRHFLYGAVGIAALAAAGGIGVAVSNSTRANAQDIPLLNVPEKAVTNSEDCEYRENYSEDMKLKGSISLPFGTLVWANDEDLAFCLLPTSTGTPLTSVGVIDLENLGWGTLITHAVGESEGYEIYDVRGTSSGIVWTEADILDGNWRVYAATLGSGAAGAGSGTGSGAADTNSRTLGSGITLPNRASSFDASSYLGTPMLLAEGGPDWETPTLTAWGSYAYWQELPKATGAANQENSLLRRCVFGAGSGSVETVYESPGRMACAPASTQGGIVFTPRAEAVNVYYQLTYIDGQTAKVLDQLTLPASMKPTEISYGKTGFSFAFDGIYSYGGGIANLGTYTPKQMPSTAFAAAYETALSDVAADRKTTKDQLTEDDMAEAQLAAQTATAEAYSACEWFRFARAPMCPPAWCGGYFMVKSSSAIVGVDLTDNWYFALPVENGAPDYGEFMASEGTCQKIVSFTQISYTPINGDSIVECRLKIWEPA